MSQGATERGAHGQRLIGRGLLAAVRWYRDAVSPALPPRCRFYPTCSSYAVTALTQYGALRGGWMAVRRVLRCGPWHPGGVDHVPSLVPDDSKISARPDLSQRRTAPGKDVGPQRRPVSQETAVA